MHYLSYDSLSVMHFIRQKIGVTTNSRLEFPVRRSQEIENFTILLLSSVRHTPHRKQSRISEILIIICQIFLKISPPPSHQHEF